MRRPPHETRDPCVCEACSSNLVEPIDWRSAGKGRWHVVLRCPNCETVSEGVFSQECVERLDERLDEGTALLVADLKALAHANFADEIERFVGALHAGAILPEDFDLDTSGKLTV
jgi:hypothetical protein